MVRIVLISMLCLAIAFLGVSGLHVHLPNGVDAASEHDHAAERGGHAHAITVLDDDHVAEHDRHGDIDIEPMAKAFGKLSLNQIIPAFALLYVLMAFVARVGGTLLLRTPPRRPPKRRFLPYFLPPSQAPPATALSR